MDFPTLLASFGAFLLLLAFFLNLLHFLKETSMLYIGLNLAGAGIACYASYLIGFTPFIVLEGTWALVALVGLIRKFL